MGSGDVRMVDNKIFYRGLTYKEWITQQDSASIEFQAVQRCHRAFPSYDLDEIKNKIFTDYISTEDNQKLIEESFGTRHINSQKLNDQMSKLTRIIFSTNSEYKSVDKRGHGDTISARFGGRGNSAETVSFRIEEKAIRQAHYLIDHNLVSQPTVTDLVRAGFVKYIEMLPIINEIRDSVTNRFILDIQLEREKLERLKVDEMLKGFEDRLVSEEDDLMESLRHIDNKEELEEIRNWTTNFINEALSYNGPTKKEVARVKEFIMRNSRLYNVLTILERERLITREYLDNVRQKGVVSPVDIVPNEEIRDI